MRAVALDELGYEFLCLQPHNILIFGCFSCFICWGYLPRSQPRLCAPSRQRNPCAAHLPSHILQISNGWPIVVAFGFFCFLGVIKSALKRSPAKIFAKTAWSSSSQQLQLWCSHRGEQTDLRRHINKASK